MSPKIQLSGLQKQVLALYRGFLRVARLKSPEERQRIEDLISAEFRKKSTSVDRKNFMYIEYLLRTGAKQLQQLSNPVTVGVSSFQVHCFFSSWTVLLTSWFVDFW